MGKILKFETRAEKADREAKELAKGIASCFTPEEIEAIRQDLMGEDDDESET